MPRIANPGSRRLDRILVIHDRFPGSEVWELLSEGRFAGKLAHSGGRAKSAAARRKQRLSSHCCRVGAGDVFRAVRSPPQSRSGGRLSG